MTEKNFIPSPYQALLDQDFSPVDAKNALRAILGAGYEPTYRGPKEAYIMDISIQLFAHSTEHAEAIFEASGIMDGPAEIRQDGHVLMVDYINVEGGDGFKSADWQDYTVDKLLDEIVPESEDDGDPHPHRTTGEDEVTYAVESEDGD